MQLADVIPELAVFELNIIVDFVLVFAHLLLALRDLCLDCFYPARQLTALSLLILILVHKPMQILLFFNLSLPFLQPAQLTQRVGLHFVVHGKLRGLHFCKSVADD